MQEYCNYVKIVSISFATINNNDEFIKIMTKTKSIAEIDFLSINRLYRDNARLQINTHTLYYTDLSLSDILKLEILVDFDLAIFLSMNKHYINNEIFERNNLKIIGLCNYDDNIPNIILSGSSVLKCNIFTTYNVHYYLKTHQRNDYINFDEITYAGLIIKNSKYIKIDQCKLFNDVEEACDNINIIHIRNNEKCDIINTNITNCKLSIFTCQMALFKNNNINNVFIFLWHTNAVISNNVFKNKLALDLFNCEITQMFNNKLLNVHSIGWMFKVDHNTSLFFYNNDITTKNILLDKNYNIFYVEKYSLCQIYNNKMITDCNIGFVDFCGVLDIHDNKFSNKKINVRCYKATINYKNNFNIDNKTVIDFNIITSTMY